MVKIRIQEAEKDHWIEIATDKNPFGGGRVAIFWGIESERPSGSERGDRLSENARFQSDSSSRRIPSSRKGISSDQEHLICLFLAAFFAGSVP